MSKSEHHTISDNARDAINKLRGLEFDGPEKLADFLKSENAVIPARDLVALGQIFATRFRSGDSQFYLPEWLVSAFTDLLAVEKVGSICDPWAGVGILLGILREATNAGEAIAITKNFGEGALGQFLVPQAKWEIGEPLHFLEKSKQEFDVVVSIPPMNVRASYPLLLDVGAADPVKIEGDLGDLILVAASSRLSESGVGLFVVPPSFFNSPRSVLGRVEGYGLGIEATFALPAGTLAPHTNIPTYLIVVRRKPSERMFVAQLSADTNTNRQIIDNLRQGREGRELQLGRFVEPQEFKGFERLRAAEVVALAERRFGAPSVPLGHLAASITFLRSGGPDSFQNLENSIYIPLAGSSDVKESIEDLSMKPTSYAQVVVDSSRSNARFVAQFLNSEVGKLCREKLMSGAVILRWSKTLLSQLRVFVPDLHTQRTMLAIEAKILAEETTIMALQNEVAELRRELWTSPKAGPLVEKRLSGLTKRLSGEVKRYAESSLEQWFETLPFPLASILRAWQATPSQDFKTKYEHLLHFFEGAAQFIGVIQLSAFSSNEAAFAPLKQKLMESMGKQHLSFKRATFGTWKLVVEFFGKQTRELLNENGRKVDDAVNERALCADMFGDPSLTLPTALSRKELAAIFSATNKMRNDWGGHGGVVGQEEAGFRNQQLVAELEKMREVTADTWSEIQLIHALHCRPRKGVFENEVAILMGSNSEFLKETRPMANWLDVERLYLSKRDSGCSLKLLPLIQVGPSPTSSKNACYFFSRLEREGARFVSYHFIEKPELTGQFNDAADAVKLLTES